jgi:hypothetical protein
MKPEKNKMKCLNCGHKLHESDLLKATNPFDIDEFIYACPKCKSMDDLVMVCDIAGCLKEATCGTPTQDEWRYRNVCGDHYREINKIGSLKDE